MSESYQVNENTFWLRIWQTISAAVLVMFVTSVAIGVPACENTERLRDQAKSKCVETIKDTTGCMVLFKSGK